jgi:hypothetical protein
MQDIDPVRRCAFKKIFNILAQIPLGIGISREKW